MILTTEILKNLKMTANEPGGDCFVDSRKNLNGLVDAFVADNSLASPMYLYLAAGTASRLERIEDAAFLFYAGQLRSAFDFERYDINPEPDGNNAATWFAYVNQAIGQSVNPAIIRQPRLFARVIQRLESWNLVPSREAYYPEFEEATAFKLDPARWPAEARAIKEDFMIHFGRRYAALLANPRYSEAVTFVQDCNFRQVDLGDPRNQARFDEAQRRIEQIEQESPPS